FARMGYACIYIRTWFFAACLGYRITVIQPELVCRTETPFKIVPCAPMVIPSYINTFRDRFVHEFEIIMNGGDTLRVVLCTNAVLGNDDRLAIEIPVTLHALF